MAHLENTIRKAYSLASVPLKMRFMDEEGDWVCYYNTATLTFCKIRIDSDLELEHAVVFNKLLLRLDIQLGPLGEEIKHEKDDASMEPENPQTEAEVDKPKPAKAVLLVCSSLWPLVLRLRRPACCTDTQQERLEEKKLRLMAKKENVEKRLHTPSLSGDRHRVLSWRLMKLSQKLEAVDEKRIAIENDEVVPFTCQAGSNRRGHGLGREGQRGGRPGVGCKMGQPRDALGDPVDGVVQRPKRPNEWVTEEAKRQRKEFRSQVQAAREDLRVAKKSGADASEINARQEALKEAQQRKMSARPHPRDKVGNEERTKLRGRFAPEKSYKMECLRNLREARREGDAEKVKECREALAGAVKHLNQLGLLSQSIPSFHFLCAERNQCQ